MALQGTLDTFALPDVLRLLANTSKSGRLLVQGDDGNGSLYLDSGAIVGGETTFAPTDEGHEVLFELLRLGDGSFLFDPADTTNDPGEPAEVEAVIEAAESSHAEWLDLSTVVPSLDVGVALADDLPDDSATVDRDRWKLIVGIGSGTTVRALGDDLELRELPILRSVRGLVDDGLAVITDASAVAAAPTRKKAKPAASAPVAPAESGSGAELPSLDGESAPDVHEDPGSDGDLPEPLPGRSGAKRGPVADPFVEAAVSEPAAGGASDVAPIAPEDAAAIERQLDGLTDSQRDLVEQAASESDEAVVDDLLEELPDGSIDRDLLKRFLGSVRA